MITEKQKVLLEVAYDQINKVFTELCKTTKRGEGDDFLYELMDIMRKIIKCTEQKKEGANNG